MTCSCFVKHWKQIGKMKTKMTPSMFMQPFKQMYESHFKSYH